MTTVPFNPKSRLKWPAKAGFATASVGLSAIELMLQVYLLELYILAGLTPSLAGLAIALAVIWDAISDPLMGILSDKTPAKSLVGKRVPYLMTGAVLICVSFAFLFSPPSGSGQTALFANLLLWYLLVNTAMTLFGVPHLSLVNDLADDEQERASLFAWNIVLGSIGLLVGIALPAYLASSLSTGSIENLLQVRKKTGLLLGILAAVGCMLTSIVVAQLLKRSGSRNSISTALPYKSMDVLKHGMRSPQFIFLAMGFMAIAIGRSFNSSLALPYYKSTLGFSENEIGIILLVLTLFIILSAPAWVMLSRTFSKSKLFVVAVSLLSVMSAIVYPLLSAKILWPVLCVAAIGGILVASIVLLESLFSDLVENEKAEQNQDISGAYYGIWRMLSKIARALGIACSGFLLSKIGYQESTLEQTSSVQTSIAWAFGPGVALFLIVGSWTIKQLGNKTSINHSTTI